MSAVYYGCFLTCRGRCLYIIKSSFVLCVCLIRGFERFKATILCTYYKLHIYCSLFYLYPTLPCHFSFIYLIFSFLGSQRNNLQDLNWTNSVVVFMRLLCKRMREHKTGLIYCFILQSHISAAFNWFVLQHELKGVWKASFENRVSTNKRKRLKLNYIMAAYYTYKSS